MDRPARRSTFHKMPLWKRSQAAWDAKTMKMAMDDVLSETLSVREASVKYGIPKPTIYVCARNLRNGQEVTFDYKRGRPKRFNDEYDHIMVKLVKDVTNRCFQIPPNSFRKLLYDVADSMKIPHRFSIKTKMSGKRFYENFMAKHPEILRDAHMSKMVKPDIYDRIQIQKFYENLATLYETFNFSPANIYNCGEAKINTNADAKQLLFDYRQLRKMSADDRGRNISVLFCVSAKGCSVPPFFVFPFDTLDKTIINVLPTDSLIQVKENTDFTADMFLEWLHHFVKFSKSSKDKPVLLVVDGRKIHVDLSVIKYAKENHVHLMSTPHRTTQKLQPFDRIFMKPFSFAFSTACTHERDDEPEDVPFYLSDVLRLVTLVGQYVDQLETPVSRFHCTDIYPHNENLFSDFDFLPSELLDIILNDRRISEDDQEKS